MSAGAEPFAKWLTVAQLAELMQIGEDKIRDRVNTKTWPHYRDKNTTRFTPEHIARIQELGHQEPEPPKRRRRTTRA
ncbi:DNA-binding protein [Arthrobacter frigidicola]|nr:DNA-binding protein [Arthrobacter frigidicola]